METFCPPKSFVDDPNYRQRRRQALNALEVGRIDSPLRPLVRAFGDLSVCYTLQCCFGHFVHAGQPDPQNLVPLPDEPLTGPIDYRLAYVALCIQRCHQGRRLRDALSHIATIDCQYIQFGCAEWFWRRHPNSFVLQVEPKRYRHLDQVSIEDREARHIARVRDRFFRYLSRIISEYQRAPAASAPVSNHEG